MSLLGEDRRTWGKKRRTMTDMLKQTNKKTTVCIQLRVDLQQRADLLYGSRSRNVDIICVPECGFSDSLRGKKNPTGQLSMKVSTQMKNELREVGR